MEIDWSKYPVENGQHELLGWAFEGDASVPEFGASDSDSSNASDTDIHLVPSSTRMYPCSQNSHFEEGSSNASHPVRIHFCPVESIS